MCGKTLQQTAPPSQGRNLLLCGLLPVLHAVYHGLSINVSFRAFLYWEDIECRQHSSARICTIQSFQKSPPASHFETETDSQGFSAYLSASRLPTIFPHLHSRAQNYFPNCSKKSRFWTFPSVVCLILFLCSINSSLMSHLDVISQKPSHTLTGTSRVFYNLCQCITLYLNSFCLSLSIHWELWEGRSSHCCTSST